MSKTAATKAPAAKAPAAKKAPAAAKPAAAPKAKAPKAVKEEAILYVNGVKAPKKVCLAYSGGLDTSIMITWLKETYGCEVVAYAADIGQGAVETEPLIKKAIATGAVKCIVLDLRKEFIEEYVWPTLKAGARYEGVYLLGTSFARPVIAKHQVLVAQKEGCDAVGHGATGKGNDQVRFELTYTAIDPTLQIVAPWKDPNWTITSREEAIDYANLHKIPVTATKKKIYSEDANLWHVSHEGGKLEHPENEHGFEMLRWTNPPEKAPSKGEYVTIGFDKGIPVSVDGKKLGAVELLETLNAIGAKHGVGLLDMVENRLVGLKSRGVYETPGGTILYAAHDWLEQLVLDRDTLREKRRVADVYADIVYDGRWFAPLRQSLDAFVNETQKVVTGTVKLKLYKGNTTLAGVESPFSIYDADLGGFSDVEMYDQKDATGFIRCFSLPMKVRNLKLGKKSPVKF
jgi:argininosuccinate synthase